MKHKLLIAGLACAVGVAFAQVQPPSAGDPRKDRAMQAVDPWKVRSHEGIKGVAPTAKPSAGFEIQMRPAPVKPRAGYIDPENPENRALAPKPAGVPRASPLAAPAKPLTPQGPLAAPNALPTPGVQK